MKKTLEIKAEALEEPAYVILGKEDKSRLAAAAGRASFAGKGQALRVEWIAHTQALRRSSSQGAVPSTAEKKPLLNEKGLMGREGFEPSKA